MTFNTYTIWRPGRYRMNDLDAAYETLMYALVNTYVHDGSNAARYVSKAMTKEEYLNAYKVLVRAKRAGVFKQ